MDEIATRLSERDEQLIQMVRRLRVVSGQQLRRLYFGDSESARRLARRELGRLVERQVLARLRQRIGGVRGGSEGYLYTLDIVGQRLLQPGRRRYRAPWTTGLSFLAHTVAVAEVYVALALLARAQPFEVATFDAEPACWREFHGPGGRRLVLKPDAFVSCADQTYEHRYFIELNRSTESLPRVTEKARLYVRYWQSGREQDEHGVFPRVLWIAPTVERRSLIIDGLGRVQPDHWRLFEVTTADQAAVAMTRGLSSGGGAS